MSSAEIGSNSEKLVALLDGEMSKDQLGDVYYELANNPDLQDEFHELIDMKNLIRNNQAAPPIVLHQQILASTGLAHPKPKGFVAGSMAFLGSKASLVVMSTLLGAFLMYFAIDKGNSIEENSNFATFDNHNKQLIEMYLPNGDTKDIPIIYNNEYNNESDYPIKAVTSVRDDIQTVENANEFNNFNFKDVVYPVQNFTIEYAVPLSSYTQSEFSKIPIIVNEYITPTILEKKFSLIVRNFIQGSYPDLDVPPLTSPVLNNLGFSLMYDIDDNYSIGLELGQENFLQRYDGIVNGKYTEIEQNFLAFWGGVSFKYNMDPLESLADLKPYGKLLIGSTDVGALAKTEIGVGFDLSETILAFVGFDGTTLMYDFKNNMFFTHKYGITYGLSMKF